MITTLLSSFGLYNVLTRRECPFVCVRGLVYK